jgi:hypothetical protein
VPFGVVGKILVSRILILFGKIWIQNVRDFDFLSDFYGAATPANSRIGLVFGLWIHSVGGLGSSFALNVISTLLMH